MQTLRFDINGMTCGGSTARVRRGLGKLDRVSDAEVDVTSGGATVAADPTRAMAVPIESAIARLDDRAKARAAPRSQQATR